MISQKVLISNPAGLHLYPAGELCKTASAFESSITFVFNDSISNAKSVLSVLGACVKSGDEIEMVCDGPDEDAAMQAVLDVLENGISE